MKWYNKLINEVAQPTSEDELNFKEKHIVDHILDPNSEEDQFTADDIKKFVNRADYDPGDDKDVYEGFDINSIPLVGQEINLDDPDDVLRLKLLKYRRKAQNKLHRIDEETSADAISSIPSAFYFEDGKHKILSNDEIVVLRNLFKTLDPKSRSEMLKKLKSDEKSFSEILAFAKGIE